MKTFVAILFAALTIWSVSQPAHAACEDMGESSSESVVLKHTSFLTSGSSQHSCDSDLGHTALHSCHLGHCAFTLSYANPFIQTYEFSTGYESSNPGIELAGITSSLFRPPIVRSV